MKPVMFCRKTSGTRRWQPLIYQFGRISSYAVAGALMGAIGSLGLLLNNWLPVQMSLYVGANLMMVALGLYLTGLTQTLAFTERAGQWLWRRVQPATRRFLPVRGAAQAFPLGMLWGWLPCGLVYSVLTMTLLSGSAARGAHKGVRRQRVNYDAGMASSQPAPAERALQAVSI